MFAAAPTPPPTTPNTAPAATPSSSSARPSRLRGLSYLRNFNHHHHHNQDNSSDNSEQSHTSSSTRNTNAPSQTTSTPVRSPPAAPSTFLNQSAGYLSGARSNRHSNSRYATPSGQEPVTHSDENLTTDRMVRRKKVGSGNTQENSQESGRNVSNTQNATVNGNQNTRAESSTSPPAHEPRSPESSGLQGLPADQMPTIRFIPHQDPRSNKPSLDFGETSRTLPHEDCVIRVGRYSERDVNANPPANVPSAAPVGFKSKVVSRKHCEFWCSQGQWYIKDVKSSSGTFLNHIRLSQPSVESRPFPVNDGDVVQLGIDFRGGEEQIFRCVKIRIECNRAWQKGLNNFNMSTHKRLRALGATAAKGDDAASIHSATECSICLMSVAPCQSLFVAPCSHVWHFKCIRPILNNHKSYPQFLCPNCRAVADLEADVDEPVSANWEEYPDSNSDNEQEDGPTTETVDALVNRSSQVATSTNGTGTPGVSPPPPQTQGTSQAINAAIASINRDLHLHSPRANSLNSSVPGTPSSAGVRPMPSLEPAPEVTTETIDIPRPWNQSIAMPNPRPDHGRLTPEGAFSGPHEVTEGPLTPRNDVGPFVFDGSAGRSGSGVADNRVSVGSG